jgi:hypothetical protein
MSQKPERYIYLAPGVDGRLYVAIDNGARRTGFYPTPASRRRLEKLLRQYNPRIVHLSINGPCVTYEFTRIKRPKNQMPLPFVRIHRARLAA